MNITRIRSVFRFIAILLSVLVGCRNQTEMMLNEKVDWTCRRLLDINPVSLGGQERKSLALSRCQNGILDSDPLLIDVWLDKGKTSGMTHLGILGYDEDLDLVGIGIKSVKLNEQNITSEQLREYPVFLSNSYKDNENHLYLYIKRITINISTSVDFREGVIFIPDSKERDIMIYIYDKKGNKSNMVKVPKEFIEWWK